MARSPAGAFGLAALAVALASTTAPARATDAEFTRLSRPPRSTQVAPRAALTREEKLSALATGVDLAVTTAFAVSPLAEPYLAMQKARDIGLDASSLALDSRHALVESDLRAIGADAAALRALARQGVVLAEDPRAQAILARIEARGREGDGAWSFYRKAVVSGPGLYGVAIAFAASALSDRVTKALMPGSFPRRSVRLAWLEGEILARGVSRSSWKAMHARARRAAEAAEKLTHDLIQLAFDQAVKEEATTLVRSRLDDLYREAMKSEPPRGRRWSPREIRLVVAEQPAFVALLRPAPAVAVAVAAPAEPPAPQAAPALPAPAAVELVSAARREGGGDPVVRVIDNEDEATHYTVERSGPQTVSAPQVDVSRFFRSTWGGERSGSLWR